MLGEPNGFRVCTSFAVKTWKAITLVKKDVVVAVIRYFPLNVAVHFLVRAPAIVSVFTNVFGSPDKLLPDFSG